MTLMASARRSTANRLTGICTLARFALALTAVLLLAGPLSAAEPSPLDHRRVMQFLDEAGVPQPVRTPADWQRRREQVLAGFQAVVGPLPPHDSTLPLETKVVETVSLDGIERQTVRFAVGDGRWATADLYLPPVAGGPPRRAAIVALHPTGVAGKRIVAGLPTAPNRQYALELAQRGYVVVAPDYPSFGDQEKYDFDTDRYDSGTLAGLVHHRRAIDLVAARDDVDPARIAAIGHSLGGHNAIFLGVVDNRVRAVVSSCGWCPFHDYYGGKLDGWTSPRYLPRIRAEYGLSPDRVPFDFPELIAALAPRPFLTISPRGDSNFDYRGVERAVPEARQVYRLLGVERALQARYPLCQHDFPPDMRREAYAFLDAALGHKPQRVVPEEELPAENYTRRKVVVPSTLDGTEQTCFVHEPAGYDPAGRPVPLVVSLHSWRGNAAQRQPLLEAAAAARGWLLVAPDFRGPNDDPLACGSAAARRDVLDAVAWVRQAYRVDPQRIYLTGSSGGGHMAMLLAARDPEPWAAVSAWVGISDLAAWHALHEHDAYGAMLRQVCGGRPGDSPEVDREYRERSPREWLSGAVDVPLDLAAGIHDGHIGSVPVRHTLAAFNVVARAQGVAAVTEDELAVLASPDGRLSKPQPSDLEPDPTYPRAIYLRRQAGRCRVTIFEGGHERLDEAAIDWLGRHKRSSPAP